MRRAAKRDQNEAEIVAALRELGHAVHQISDDDGFPDLIVWNGRKHIPVEVKVPGERLTPRQKAFHTDWPGPLHVVRTVEEAVFLVENA